MPVSITEIVSASTKMPGPVAATLSDAWAAVIGDRVAAWRLKNAAATQIKVVEEIKKSGLALVPSKIPERYAFAWFEEASKQDEPEIQELFARLLANASRGDENALDRRHLDILSKLTPDDALVMKMYFDNPIDSEDEFYRIINDKLPDRGWISFERLLNLGLIERFISVNRKSVQNLIEHTFLDITQGRSSETYFPPSIVTEHRITSTTIGLSLYCAIQNV